MGDPACGIPYGRFGRLLMVLIATRAKFQQSPDIWLGDSLTDVLSTLGVGRSGYYYDVMHSQIKAIMGLTVDVTRRHRYDGRHAASTTTYKVGSGADSADFPLMLHLTRPFYEEVINKGVPVCAKTVLGLKKSLALDLYCWITWRAYSMVPGKALKLHMRVLHQQFATRNKCMRGFKFQVGEQLALLESAYPELRNRWWFEGSYLVLDGVTPHVPPVSRKVEAEGAPFDREGVHFTVDNLVTT